MSLDEVFEELRRLNEPVPRPLVLPTEAQVRDEEQRAGLSFHPDLRRFLLEASDVTLGYLEPVTIGGGHTAFKVVLRSARDYGVPDELVPICEDNADFYCITSSGQIVYWSHNGATNETWPDLAAWISDVWIAGN